MADRIVATAGTLLWRPRRGGTGREYAVIHRQAYDDWSLPKGKIDPGETPPQAAVRETLEETGFHCVLGRYLHRVDRPQRAGRIKRVDYWAARVTGGAFTVNKEVDRLEWLSLSAAIERVDYDADRAVLARGRARRSGDRSVLLVRHATAGKRGLFDGPDDLRPLDKRGRAQARMLVDQLGAFGADRVHTARPVRCAQTVAPLAKALGRRLRPVPELSEDDYAVDRKAGRAAMAAIAANPRRTPVVCSQGGVIPDLVAHLRRRAGLDPIDTDTAKGAGWVLTYAGDRLVATDLLPAPDRW